ncbi:hypothetical protein GGTG_07079 [Gaeumannomyces tritici R3-111a-1]|uniref:Uncharacterized protein n=1 Tax=Gaeumannomyces tritici (strain R3-111a-1) TaxID=644352 RepID=J3P0N4_GAET3|nr:hypothetical protein GGTG_07079 [Gaeumannomyces tritici R3-111a-1]EJT77167.1 hypothetical protein GGTG_07079 [Gaeumannomyces tritici R3-111a-1]
MLCHAAPRKVLLDRHSIAVDEPNFLDYVSCKEQPKGICTLTLVLTPDGKDMGALVFDNECSKVIGLAHSIHWDEKTAFPPGAFRGDLSVEPRKDGKPTYWLNDEESGGDVDLACSPCAQWTLEDGPRVISTLEAIRADFEAQAVEQAFDRRFPGRTLSGIPDGLEGPGESSSSLSPGVPPAPSCAAPVPRKEWLFGTMKVSLGEAAALVTDKGSKTGNGYTYGVRATPCREPGKPW